MPYSYAIYTGNGSQTQYAVSFPYIRKEHIVAYVNYSLTTAFTWVNDSTIQFTTAPGNGQRVEIRRYSPTNARLVDYTDGSTLVAADLDTDSTQHLYKEQELDDDIKQSVYVDPTTGLPTASNQRITNVLDPVAAQDAATKNYVDTTTVASAGDTMTGPLAMSTNKITGVGDPTNAQDASTKNYTDTQDALRLKRDGTQPMTGNLNFNSNKGINLAEPTNPQDAATKNYVDTTFVDNTTDLIDSTETWVSNDTKIATTAAADARHTMVVNPTIPTVPAGGWQVGKTWLQNDPNKTLSYWTGSNWSGIASGGTFTLQPTVIYVDSVNGDDANDGHRIINPKKTIKNAVQSAAAGDIIKVAPGVYQEVLPIDITVDNLSIVGDSQRSCFVHPTVATQEQIMFRCNSGTYIDGFTFAGLKASGARGGNAIDSNATYGLPASQGWVAGFYPGCTIKKSPYINNCSNFADASIDNSAFNPNNYAGTGGDLTSAPTGGGIIVDGSLPAVNSPLRSFVINEFTQVCLDGPGLLVCNNGYAQAVSFFGLFCHYHAKALSGGQINMEVGTTDFGRYGLIADGKSSSAIFTATANGNASAGATTFAINAPTAAGTWFGDATRPATNMLVQIGADIYPILSATANGGGWNVVISRPDPANRAVNLGLINGHSGGATVSFFLRSMISTASHTMEYAGSGTNYNALPENGGVPVEANEVVNLNNGKVWLTSTDQNGKFKVGDTFQVDQQTGFVTIDPNSYSPNIVQDLSPELGGNLDVLTRNIYSSVGNVQINDDLAVTGSITSNGINVLNFTQSGTGAVTRTIDSKLKDVVSIKDFGAVGDGTTNDRAAIQAALNTGKNIYVPDGTYLFNSSISFTANGQTIYGAGNNSILKSAAGSVYIQSAGFSNISIIDLKIDGSAGTDGGFRVTDGSSNVLVSRVYWYQGQQRVWLYACSSIKIVDCTFDTTGYGIIQQVGYASSFVLIDGNTAINMANDFVEANCAGTPSSSWTITSNVYKGSQGYPTPATEKRFVGITSVNGVVIDGNVVEKVAGDAAVHLEDTLGETVVSNNTFDNCLGSGGNSGYIYLLNTAENTVISGNVFLRTDASLATAAAVQCNNGYSNSIQFTGNRVAGTSAGCNLDGLFLAYYSGPAVISDNIFEKINRVLDASANLVNASFTGNYIQDTAEALAQTPAASGQGFVNCLIANNVFSGTTGTYDIYTRQNTNGTSAPNRVTVTGNKFCKKVEITGQIGATAGTSGDAQDIQVTNNIFSSAASLTFSGTMSRRISSGNVFEATGTYDITGTTLTGTTVTGTTVNATTLAATNLGNFEGLIDYRPLKGRTSFSDYQNGVSLTGVSGDFSNISDDVVQQVAYAANTLNIGHGFILPKNYSGTVSYTVGQITAGAFDLYFESSTNGTTWTTLQSWSNGTTGAKTYTFSSLSAATALRFRFANANGTTGYITVQNVVIPGLTAAQIAQATGAPRVYLNSVHFPNVGTTASAANAFLDNSTTPANRLLRSTSSARYKTQVEDLETQRADAILGLRPVWYRSLAEADPVEWSYYGLIAEEVAEIEPRLVTWTYPADAYETVEETIEVDGNEVTRTVERLKEGAAKVPDGVQYDRVAVLLLDIVKRQQQAIEALQARISAS